MSDKSQLVRSFAARRSRLPEIPLWATPLLLIAEGVLGLLISIPTGSVGMPYLIVFAIAAIVGTLLVVPQGLVVAVAQIPLLFTLITPTVAWFTGSFADPGKGGVTDSTPPKTRLITAAYPIIQHFPFLALVTALCAIIAIWRYVDLRRANAKVESTTRSEARARQKRDKAEVRSASRAHDRIADSERRRATNRRSASARGDTTERVAASDLIRRAGQNRQKPQPKPTAQPRTPQPRTPQTRTPQPRPERRRIEAEYRPGQPRFESRPQPTRPTRPAQPTRPARPADRLVVPNEQPQRREVPSQRLWGEGENSRRNSRNVSEWPPRQERPRRQARGVGGGDSYRGFRDERRWDSRRESDWRGRNDWSDRTDRRR